MAKNIEGAVIAEGYRPGVTFRNGAGTWVNGTPIHPDMEAALRKDGYALRAATAKEEVKDALPVIPSVNSKNRPKPQNGPGRAETPVPATATSESLRLDESQVD